MNELSVIIPCIYSVKMLPRLIDELAVYLMSNPADVDIIIVINERVQSAGHIVHYVDRKYPWLKFEMLQRKGSQHGYGALARFGMAYSTSRYAVLISPYGEDDISIIFQMWNKL